MTVTTSPPMSSRLREFSRRSARWLLPAALLALVPKCLLCVLAYTGLGVALGFGGPEICGASTSIVGGWTVWLSALGLAVFATGIFRRRSTAEPEHSRASFWSKPKTGIETKFSPGFFRRYRAVVVGDVVNSRVPAVNRGESRLSSGVNMKRRSQTVRLVRPSTGSP
jgi:hypothetical protein